MLIAIMGDTFERVTEHKELNSRRTKLDLLGDFASLLKEEKQDPACFLYVIQPKLDDDDVGKVWEGAMANLMGFIKKQFQALEKKVGKDMKNLKADAVSSEKRE